MPSTASVTVEIQVQTETVLQVEVEPSQPEHGTPLLIMASVAGLADTAAPVAKATVRGPSVPTRHVPLADDGLDADRVAGDGTFTGRLWGTPVTGAYDVQVDLAVGGAAGGQRVASLPVTVDPGTDTDSDGLPDGWERAHGTTLTVPDADADPDADGLSNLEELALSTCAFMADTDGDGLLDGQEDSSGEERTDPAYADSDLGGVPDGYEANSNRNPTVAYDDVMGRADHLLLDPALPQFGVVAVGGSREMRMFLTNSGTLPLQPAAGVAGDGGTAYSTVATWWPAQLLPGRTAVLALVFSPPAEGVWEGLLDITSQGMLVRSIPLHGMTPAFAVPDAGARPDASLQDAAVLGDAAQGADAAAHDSGHMADATVLPPDAAQGNGSQEPSARSRACACAHTARLPGVWFWVALLAVTPGWLRRRRRTQDACARR
jgi:hypothetical protein